MRSRSYPSESNAEAKAHGGSHESRSLSALILAVLVFACGACGGDGDGPDVAPSATPIPPSITIPAGAPIVIGVSAALSGAQAAAGQDLRDAVTLAVEEFGQQLAGRNVVVEAADDGCNEPETSVAAARHLLAEPGLVAVVGPMCTTGAQAANDEYEDAGIVHITPTATRANLSALGSQFFFRTAWRDDDQGRVQALYARDELRAANAVVFDDSQPYGRALADAFIDAFANAGGTITSRERVVRGQTGFTAQATRVIASDPDVVVYEGLYPEGALLLAALRFAGYNGVFIGPDSLFSAQGFLTTTGPTGEGAVLTSGPVPDAGFVERFTARFARAPSTPFVLQAYDGARMTLTALESAASTDGGGAIIDRGALIRTLRGQAFAGLTGSIDFGDRGDREGDAASDLGLAVFRVTSGAFERVE